MIKNSYFNCGTIIKNLDTLTVLIMFVVHTFIDYKNIEKKIYAKNEENRMEDATTTYQK